MKRLTSVKELQALREQAQARLAELEKKIQVKVHLGTCGIASGANEVLKAFIREIETRKLSDVVVLRAACIGLCGREPVTTVIDPKNGEDRLLTLPSPIINELKEFQEVGNGLVFPSDKKPDKPFTYLKHWQKALKDSGVTNFRFHDLRHSAGSYLPHQPGDGHP